MVHDSRSRGFPFDKDQGSFCAWRQRLNFGALDVVGDFADVAEARQVAIDTATKNRFFAEWCVGFDLEDAEGNILWQWDKNDRRTT